MLILGATKTKKKRTNHKRSNRHLEPLVRHLRRKVHGEYHPCTCDAGGNGGQQCYNCLNGAHYICDGDVKCNRHKKRKGRVGVMLSFKEANA